VPQEDRDRAGGRAPEEDRAWSKTPWEGRGRAPQGGRNRVTQEDWAWGRVL
jgi:hypothetical protein